MNLDDLIKLAGLLDGGKYKSPSSFAIGERFIGKYVIVRSRNEGINAGVVSELDETGIILQDARRLYYHKPANKELSWYEGVALEGLSSDSKVGAPVTKLIVEDYSITVCTKDAEKSIRGAKTNVQS